MNPEAVEFRPQGIKQDAANALGNPVEQVPEQSTDLLQQHQQRHENKRKIGAGQARQKQRVLTRRQRRNDASGYVPPQGAESRTTAPAATPTPKEQIVCLETINVACLEHHRKFVAERKAAILVLQEHKIKEGEETKMKKYFEGQGWELKCGPCDAARKNQALA